MIITILRNIGFLQIPPPYDCTPSTVIRNDMCLCMKLSVTVPEVVSVMDTFTFTLYMTFHTSSTVQIVVSEVIPWAWSLMMRCTRLSH